VTTETHDVVSVLMHDHREVEEMFDQLERGTDPQERRRLADQVTIELIRHSIAEEMYLYPATRRHVPDGDAIADKEIADHAEVEKILKELEKADPASDRFAELCGQLIADVKEHVGHEEDTLFPALQRHCGSDELGELGKKVEAAKKMAPTRPHPGAPDRPPLNKLLAPGAGLVDRARDFLSGRGKE
jgi:hemerythrin superfamily protein